MAHDVDPGGLEEFSVVFTDRSLNHMSRTFQQVMLDINDIIRFNLSQFLARTDDPVSYLPLFNVKTQQIDKVACPKVYHINVILVLEAETGNLPAQMVRIRVIFDRAGIRRVETS